MQKKKKKGKNAWLLEPLKSPQTTQACSERNRGNVGEVFDLGTLANPRVVTSLAFGLKPLRTLIDFVKIWPEVRIVNNIWWKLSWV